MSIADSLLHSVSNAQLHSVKVAVYRFRMDNIKDTLRANLLALIRLDAGGDLPGTQNGVTALAKRAGKLTSWSQRLAVASNAWDRRRR